MNSRSEFIVATKAFNPAVLHVLRGLFLLGDPSPLRLYPGERVSRWDRDG